MSQRVIDKINVTNQIRPFLDLIEKYDNIGIEEIQLNQPKKVFIKTYKNIVLLDDDRFHTTYLTDLITNMRLWNNLDRDSDIYSIAVPYYPYRFSVVHNHFTDNNIALTLRIQKVIDYDLSSYITNKDNKEWYQELLLSGANIVIVGATGSGKTSFMNSSIQYLAKKKQQSDGSKYFRIITIESARELNRDNFNNHVGFISHYNKAVLAKIVNITLRFTPDSIIIGELDTTNTAEYLRLANTGHKHCYASFHVNTRNIEQIYSAFYYNLTLDRTINYEETRTYVQNSLDYAITIEKEKKKFHVKIYDLKNNKEISL